MDHENNSSSINKNIGIGILATGAQDDAGKDGLTTPSMHGTGGDKSLQASVHSIVCDSGHRTATAADAVAAAKEQARNAAAYNLGAWAVMERGHNISVTPREMVGRSDYNRALQEMEDGMSVDSIVESDEEFHEDLDMQYVEDEAAAAANEEGLARAFVVEEGDDEVDPSHLPAGLEFDPDAKPPELIRRHNSYRTIRFHSFVAAGMSVIPLIGLVVALRFRMTVPEPLPDRAVLGIREYVVERLLSADDAEQVLRDPTNPYRRALDWIQNVDAMALTPQNDTKFTQRFMVAYLYFCTSVNHPWNSGCAPLSSTDTVPARSTGRCEHKLTVNGVSAEATYVTTGTHWLGPDDECTWGGVTCDQGGNIQKLQLGGSNLTGSFPVGIARFPFLCRVSLSYGALAGPLPTVFGRMKHLRFVGMVGLQLSGTIPEQWYQSRGLQYIDVGNNNINGTISEKFAHWRDMKALLLDENALTGSIPSAGGKLKSIYHFSLSSNQLTGTIPTGVGEMRYLMIAKLDRNKLTGTIPTEVGRNRLLGSLGFQSNRLSGTIPTEVSKLSNLEVVDLSNNQLSGSILPLANLTNIRTIRIANNECSGLLPPEIGKLKYMEEFIASGNNFTGVVPRKICNLVAPKNQPAPEKLLTVLQLDCAVSVDENAIVEISCPSGCCTRCCDSTGATCTSTVNN